MTPDPFARAESEFARLRGERDAGRIDQAAFDAALRALMFEHAGRWWMLGVDSGRWYAHDGKDWSSATPPRQSATAATMPMSLEPIAPKPPPVAQPPELEPTPMPLAVAVTASTGLPTAYKLAYASVTLSGLLVLALGIVMHVRLLNQPVSVTPDRVDIDLAISPLVLAAFLLFQGFAALSSRYLVALLVPAVVAAGGLIAIHYHFGTGYQFSWWRDLTVAVGGAGFVGALVGAIVRARSRRA
jgi:hypothetical protein